MTKRPSKPDAGQSLPPVESAEERTYHLLCVPTWSTTLPAGSAKHDRRQVKAEKAGQLRFDADELAGQPRLF